MAIIGKISMEIIAILKLDINPDTPVYIGESNISHMKRKHPNDFQNYGYLLSEIIEKPDYVGINPSNGSLEFVKEIMIGQEFIKVAVRVSKNGKFYARTLYKLNTRRTLNYIRDGKLIRIDRKG